MLKYLFSPLALTAAFTNVALANDAAHGQCLNPPAYLVSGVDELISRSPRISLAMNKPFTAPADGEKRGSPSAIDREKELKKATESGAQPERYRSTLTLAKLVVLEDVKGEGPGEIYLAQAPQGDAADGGNFDHHKDETFWAFADAGRVPLTADCTLKPTFEEGATYLIFAGQPHVKAYERIDEPNDAWLAYVRKAVTAE